MARDLVEHLCQDISNRQHTDTHAHAKCSTITCARAFTDVQASMARDLVEHLCRDMEAEGIEGCCVTLKLKATDFRVRACVKQSTCVCEKSMYVCVTKYVCVKQSTCVRETKYVRVCYKVRVCVTKCVCMCNKVRACV